MAIDKMREKMDVRRLSNSPNCSTELKNDTLFSTFKGHRPEAGERRRTQAGPTGGRFGRRGKAVQLEKLRTASTVSGLELVVGAPHKERKPQTTHRWEATGQGVHGEEFTADRFVRSEAHQDHLSHLSGYLDNHVFEHRGARLRRPRQYKSRIPANRSRIWQVPHQSSFVGLHADSRTLRLPEL